MSTRKTLEIPADNIRLRKTTSNTLVIRQDDELGNDVVVFSQEAFELLKEFIRGLDD